MASKRVTTRKAPDKRLKAKELRELAKKARGEVAKLIKRDLAGTITGPELQTGLKELEQNLKRMSSFIHTFK
jgi:hypothetical protein